MHKITKHSLITICILINTLCLSTYKYSQSFEDWTAPLKQCWFYPTEGMTTTRIASDNENKIFLALTNGKVISINNFGKLVWKTELGGENSSELDIYDKKLLIVTTKESHSSINSINKDTGTVSSIKMFNKSDYAYILTTEKNTILITETGRMLSLNTQNKLIWEKNIEAKITTEPLLFDNNLAFGTSNKTFVVFNKDTGIIKSQINLGEALGNKLIYRDKIIYLGDQIGNIKSISLETKEKNWEAKTGGKIVDIAKYKDKLLISSNDNFIYLLTEQKGDKVWKRKLAGRIIGKAMLDNELAIFLTNSSNVAVIVSLLDGNIVNKIELDQDNYYVSKPIYFSNQIILPTQNGLYSFSPECEKKQVVIPTSFLNF